MILTIELCTYANLTVFNRIDYLHKTGFGVK